MSCHGAVLNAFHASRETMGQISLSLATPQAVSPAAAIILWMASSVDLPTVKPYCWLDLPLCTRSKKLLSRVNSSLRQSNRRFVTHYVCQYLVWYSVRATCLS